jgi:hypothetical protein
MFKALLRRTAGPAASSPTPVLHQQGYLDARSTHHVAGWMRDLNSPTTRLAFEVRLDGAVLHRGVADRFSQTLVAVGVGDGAYAFHVRYPTPLSADARDRAHRTAITPAEMVFARPSACEVSSSTELSASRLASRPGGPSGPRRSASQDARASRRRITCSPTPLTEVATLASSPWPLASHAQQPAPNTAASPTRPLCLSQMPPLLTAAATCVPSQHTAPTVS